jgi:hypothetical protein
MRASSIRAESNINPWELPIFVIVFVMMLNYVVHSILSSQCASRLGQANSLGTVVAASRRGSAPRAEQGRLSHVTRTQLFTRHLEKQQNPQLLHIITVRQTVREERICRELRSFRDSIGTGSSTGKNFVRYFYTSDSHSCREHFVEFIKHLGQLFTEQLVGFAEAAALVERGEFKILRVNAQAGGDVVADEVESGELFGTEFDAGLGLVHEPFVEARGDGFGERFEHGLLFQRKADERDEVGEASGLRAAFDLVGRGGGEGVPEIVLGPGGVGGE